MNLEKFPRYTEYDPKVPVWCLTPNHGGCLHRFFDTCPISPSGKYLAVFQMPTEERRPEVGEAGNVLLVDLESAETWIVAQTCGWETQMGANINWGKSDNELFFNDVEAETLKPFAWKLNPLTGDRQKLEGTVYHCSPDGKWLISANMTKMRKTQPGYGVVIPGDGVRPNVGLADDDGFYITDTESGKTRLLVSIKDAFTKSNPAPQMDDPDKYEIYGFHSKFNPQGDKLMLSFRWFPKSDSGEQLWDMFKKDFHSVQYAWVTCDIDGSNLHCAIGPEQWEKGGHHATWFPDGRRISMNLRIDRDEMRFVKVNYDGSGLEKIIDGCIGSGHPTVTPDDRHILADTYTWSPKAFGDGTTPLRWVDIQTGEDITLARINTAHPYEDTVLRIDPHPVWTRDWKYFIFNAYIGGTRRVYIADMSSLI